MIERLKMKIDHIAIWVEDLEKMKDFYTKYFGMTANDKYVNPTKGFSSYFLTCGSGDTRIELMNRKDITDNLEHRNVLLGLTHFAFGLATREAVFSLTEHFRNEGITILGEPRITGDGYLESIIEDPEGNVIELVFNLGTLGTSG